MRHRVRVWDLPVRLFHWALALAVIGLVATAKIGGDAMAWHVRLGYTVAALLLFRLAWGFAGGHWARFAQFLYPPRALLAYLRGQPQPDHRVGHSPLGAFSVFAMLLVLAVQVGTGLVIDDEIAFVGPLNRFVASGAGLAAASWHRNAGEWLVIATAVLHVLAVLFYLVARRENLVRAMVTGDKELEHSSRSSRDDVWTRLGAAVLLGLSAAAVVGMVRLGG